MTLGPAFNFLILTQAQTIWKSPNLALAKNIAEKAGLRRHYL